MMVTTKQIPRNEWDLRKIDKIKNSLFVILSSFLQFLPSTSFSLLTRGWLWFVSPMSSYSCVWGLLQVDTNTWDLTWDHYFWYSNPMVWNSLSLSPFFRWLDPYVGLIPCVKVWSTTPNLLKYYPFFSLIVKPKAKFSIMFWLGMAFFFFFFFYKPKGGAGATICD